MFSNLKQAQKEERYRSFKSTILSGADFSFESMATALFRFQAEHNPVYAQWCRLRGLSPKSKLRSIAEIPHLPIRFFKSHQVSIFAESAPQEFISSGTGKQGSSHHLVYDLPFYDQLALRNFSARYGSPTNYFIAALLPSYLERQGSSLIRMAAQFINASADRESGFFLDDLAKLSNLLAAKKAAGVPILLLGVSFALLHLAEQYPQNLAGAIVMETGGMKGRRKEMVRSELHAKIASAFALEKVHSEYGMTELFSQAYSSGAGIFHCPAQMRVQIRQVSDPFCYERPGKTGGLKIIDLGNVDSCAFIETEDLGRQSSPEAFEVLGRFDHADIRGCNLMLR